MDLSLIVSNVKIENRNLEKRDQHLLDALRDRWRVPSRDKDRYYKFHLDNMEKRIQEIFSRMMKKWITTPNVPVEFMVYMNGTFVGDVNLRYYMRDSPPLEDLILLLCIIRRSAVQVQYEVDQLSNQHVALRGGNLKAKTKELSALKKLDEEFKRIFLQIASPEMYGFLIQCYKTAFEKSYAEGSKKTTRSDFKRECKMFSVNPATIKKYSVLSVYLTLIVKGEEKPKTLDEFWWNAAQLEKIPEADFENFVKKHMYEEDYPMWLSGKLQEDDRKRKYEEALQKQHANSYVEAKALKKTLEDNKIVKINKPGEGAW